MTDDQMKYCKGCGYINGGGSEPTCDFLAKTGKMRACPVGEGCPYHTKFHEAEDKKKQLAEVRKLFDDGETAQNIAIKMGWTLSKTRQFLRKNGMTRKPGWNVKGKPREPKPKAEPKPKPEKPFVVPSIEAAIVPVEAKPSNITLGQFLGAIKALLPDKLGGAELFIDGQPVRELYGYSVTMPEGKLTVDLFTRR